MKKGQRIQYLVTLALSLSALTCGVSLNWATPVIPKLHDHSAGINITTAEISWVASLSSAGYMTGSMLTRYTSDMFGRRGTILGSALPLILGTIVVLNSTTAWMLCVTRFTWGIGTGMVGTVSGIYTAEIADKEIRGTLSTFNRFMLTFGSSLVMAIGPFVSFQTINYILLVLPICYFVVCWFIPETPYYYLKEGKVDAARQSLKMLTGNGDEKVLEERLSAMRSDVRKEMLRSGSVKELFTGKQYRKAIIIVLGIKITQLMSGVNAIQQYFGRIIQESSTSISLSTALIIFGVLRLLVGVSSLTLVDKIGRKPLLFYSYLFSGIILAILGACFIMDMSALTYLGMITFIGMLLNTIIATVGYSSLGYVIPTELFPINVKSIAMTFVNLFGGFLNFLSVKGYQGLKDIAGMTGVFWFYGSVALAGAVFAYFVVPETKGKSLREIQIELQGKYLDEADEKLKQVIEVGDGVDIQLIEASGKDTEVNIQIKEVSGKDTELSGKDMSRSNC